MNDIKTLVSFELSRFKGATNKAVFYSVFIIYIVIFMYLLHNTSLYMIGFTSIAMFTAMSFAVSLFITISTTSSERHWWLTLSYARWKLLSAKLITLLYSSIIILLFSFTSGVIFYTVSSYAGWLPSEPLSEIFTVFGISLLLSIVILPFPTILALLYILFRKGWAKIGLFISGIILYSSFFMVLMSLEHSESFFNALTNSDNVLLILLIICCLYLFKGCAFWLTSTIGMKRLNLLKGQRKYQTDKQIPHTERSLKLPTLHAANKALFQLEWIKHNLFSRKTPIWLRLINYTIIISFTIVTYLLSGKEGVIADLTYGMFLVVYSFIFPFSLFSTNMAKDKWLISLPFKRTTVLKSKITSIWLMATQVIGLSLLGMVVATCVAIFTKQTTVAILLPALPNVLKIALFMYSVIFISLLIYQLFIFATSSRNRGVAFLPILLSFYAGMNGSMQLLVSGNDGIHTITHYYTFLTLLILVGLPIGFICFKIGAKHLNEAVYTNADKRSF